MSQICLTQPLSMIDSHYLVFLHFKHFVDQVKTDRMVFNQRLRLVDEVQDTDLVLHSNNVSFTGSHNVDKYFMGIRVISTTNIAITTPRIMVVVESYHEECHFACHIFVVCCQE